MLTRQSWNGKPIVRTQLAIFQAEHIEHRCIIQVKCHVNLVTIDSTTLLKQHFTAGINEKDPYRVTQPLVSAAYR